MKARSRPEFRGRPAPLPQTPAVGVGLCAQRFNLSESGIEVLVGDCIHFPGELQKLATNRVAYINGTYSLEVPEAGSLEQVLGRTPPGVSPAFAGVPWRVDTSLPPLPPSPRDVPPREFHLSTQTSRVFQGHRSVAQGPSDLILMTSAETPFPNKVTITGTRDEDFHLDGGSCR